MNIYLYHLQHISTPGKYIRWYINIIQRAQQRATTKKEATALFGYNEKHHILPKSFNLGGEKDKENYAYLTAKEHFVCHHLLAKMTTGKERKRAMYSACWLMCHKHINNRRYKITAKVYEILKTNSSWNKGLTGLIGHSCSEKLKKQLSDLWINKKRSTNDIENMKKGWEKRILSGYIPHNKGKHYDTSAKAISCIFISPDGIEYTYTSFRKGCIVHKLHASKISEVKNGIIPNYNGWTVRTLNTTL